MIRFSENFFKAVLEAALIRILSQNPQSSHPVYMPASCYPMRGCAVIGVTFLGPNTAGLAWCSIPGVGVYQESS